MKTKVKIILCLIALCASCFCAIKRRRSSPTKRSQSHEDPYQNASENFLKVNPVRTVIGKNITLECITKFTLQKDDIVEWSKDNLEIFTVKDGKEKIHNDSYKDRLRLTAFTGELSGHVISLNILHVKDSDKGTYGCCIRNLKLRCIKRFLVVENESGTTRDPHKQKGNSLHFSTTFPPRNGRKHFGIAGPVIFGFLVLLVLALLYNKYKNQL